ncbi:MAG: threonine/serine exporter family protein [Candidatus Marinarcus sp.]|uniref:threonine/serine exporter family protein n=1 Tax=Candidatus Marinarcus sp. TaxID=3100987 RepID=UPI003AFFC6B2
MSAILIKFLLDALFSAIPAVGFGMVFNVPKSALKFCALGGAITYTTRTLFLNLGLSIELSTFLASLLIGMITVYWSRKYIVPRPIYTVASIIPLIPGTYAFSAMISLMDMNTHGVSPELISLFVENGLKSISILGAISFGLALPSLYFIRYNRPII